MYPLSSFFFRLCLLFALIPHFLLAQATSHLSILGDTNPDHDISTYQSFVFKDNLYFATVHTIPNQQYTVISKLNALENDLEGVFNINLMRAAIHKDFMILSGFEGIYDNTLKTFLTRDGATKQEVNLSGHAISNYIEAGNKLYFGGEGVINVSDGTLEGTYSLSARNTNSFVRVQEFQVLGSVVYFIATDLMGRWGLYKVVGNQYEFVFSAHKSIVKDNSLYVASGSIPYYLTKINEDSKSIYDFKMIPIESDGIVYDSWSYFSQFAIVNDKLIIAARLPYQNEKLFVLNDDVFRDFYILPNEFLLSSDAYFLGVVNNKLIFHNRKSETDSTPCLWVSDGTTQGTKILREDLSFGSNPGSSLYPVHSRLNINFSDRLFFNGKTNSSGLEIFYTDGTTQGTKLLKEVREGSEDSFPADLVFYKGNLYFEGVSNWGVKKIFKYKIECQSEVKVNDYSALENVQSERRIISSTKIETSSTHYRTNQSILLQPGFTVGEGKVFETHLNAGCIFK